MRKTVLPSVDRLAKFLVEDGDGSLRWKINKPPRGKAGKIAGKVNKEGYIEIRLDGVLFLAIAL